MGRADRAFLFIAFGSYCFIYPSSLVLMVLDKVPAGTEWMASFMLVLEGIIASAWVAINYGRWRGLVASMAILCIAFSVEAIGVTTGFPFGQYSYSNVLYPKILSVVPLGITFAWLMIILSSFFTARFLIDQLLPTRRTGHSLLRSGAAVGLAALLTVVADLQMEPVAVHIQGYWTWTDTGGWYGVPISNFVAWFGTSILMGLVLIRLIGPMSHRAPFTLKTARVGWLPLALYQMNLIMFTAINLSHPSAVAGILGVVVEAAVAAIILCVRPTPRLVIASPAVPRPLIVEIMDDGAALDA